MMTITQAPRVAPNPDSLSAEELIAELRSVDRERAEMEARRDQLATDLAQRAEQHGALITNAREFWGSNFRVAPLGDPALERLGADLATADEHLGAIDARRDEVLAALCRRADRYAAAIAEEGAAIEREAAALAARQERLRELWAPLAAFEGLPAGDPPLAGATSQLALGLASRRDQLAQRGRTLARLRTAGAGS